MDIRNIVDVQITRETARITQVGFGTPLILGLHTKFAERIKFYADMEEVADDFAITDLEYLAANAAFSQALKPEQVAIGRRDAGDSDVADSLDEIIASGDAGNQWYCLILTSRTDADIAAAAAWIETRNKIFVACSDAAAILNPASTTDIGAVLSAANYSRTALLYSDDEAKYPDAAWVGLLLPQEPGTPTWALKELTGITADDLNATAITSLKAKNVNYYVTVAGRGVTQGGNTAQPEWIDVMVGADWIQARASENIFTLLVTEPKVPYTDAGISQVVNALREILQEAKDRLILDSFTITTPLASSISAAQKATRELVDVTFSGTLAGGIHTATIRGVVSY